MQNSNEKRGENLLFWRSHSYVDCDLQKKRSSLCFPLSVRPAASTVFPNLALRVKILPTSDIYQPVSSFRRCCFRCFLSIRNALISLTFGGILFHIRGPLYLIDCFVMLILQKSGKRLDLRLVLVIFAKILSSNTSIL